MRPYKSFVLPLFPGREMLAVFPSDGGSEMKGRVIYKYIKNECICEVLFFPAILRSPLLPVGAPPPLHTKPSRIPTKSHLFLLIAGAQRMQEVNKLWV